MSLKPYSRVSLRLHPQIPWPHENFGSECNVLTTKCRVDLLQRLLRGRSHNPLTFFIVEFFT